LWQSVEAQLGVAISRSTYCNRQCRPLTITSNGASPKSRTMHLKTRNKALLRHPAEVGYQYPEKIG